MGYGVYIPPEASERELRFSVELAQLAGFCSMGVGVPPVIRSPGEALPGMKYLCAAGYAPGVGIVPAPPGEDAARAWQPGALAEYLSDEVTGTPGQSMAAYWCATRGDLADEYRVE